MPFMTNGKRDYKKWNEEGRFCSVCSNFKIWDEFSEKNSIRNRHKSPKMHQTKQPKCKSCANIEVKNWRISQTPERLKDLYLKRTYNISYKEYISILDKQNYCCPLCNKILNTTIGTGELSGDTAVVDHCHTTGKVRGILCNECNRGLGYFRDNIGALMKATKYLSGEDLPPEGGQ